MLTAPTAAATAANDTIQSCGARFVTQSNDAQHALT
jgi:hypothetical protein